MLEADMLRLRRLLERTVPALPGTADGSASARGVSILNVACGACDEARTLSEFLAARHAGPGGRPTPTSLVGLDIRERELDEARERFRNSPMATFEFLRADASRPGAAGDPGRTFDTVFLRHQNLYNGGTLWRRIFEQALDRLDESGSLIITSYFDREHDLAVRAFESLGAELIANQRNRNTRPLPFPGKSVDRHIAVFRRSQKRRPVV